MLEALEDPREVYRSAVARTVDEIRGRLSRQERPDDVQRWTIELGPLGQGRIDAGRMAGIVGGKDVLDRETAERMGAALDVLAELDAAGPEAFTCRVPAGGDLREEAIRALARLGRGFGAARAAALSRTGSYREEDHGGYLEAFPPRMWNRAERTIAPPLVLEVEGSDLRAAGLAELLDGGQKLALLVDGPAPPAPLAPLITPGVLVVQTEAPADLERVATFEGPAACAVFPEGAGAARFVHDPRDGSSVAERLTVEQLPDVEGLRPVGSVTAFRQAEELKQLVALAGARGATGVPEENGGGPEATAGSAEEVQPADRLAAWLLRQASLDDVG
jgi:hypothetical protein